MSCDWIKTNTDLKVQMSKNQKTKNFGMIRSCKVFIYNNFEFAGTH